MWIASSRCASTHPLQTSCCSSCESCRKAVCAALWSARAAFICLSWSRCPVYTLPYQPETLVKCSMVVIDDSNSRRAMSIELQRSSRREVRPAPQRAITRRGCEHRKLRVSVRHSLSCLFTRARVSTNERWRHRQRALCTAAVVK